MLMTQSELTCIGYWSCLGLEVTDEYWQQTRIHGTHEWRTEDGTFLLSEI